MKEYESTFEDVSAEEFLDIIEYMILSNPEMDGVEMDDSKGRTWFIQKTSVSNSSVVN